MAEIFLITGARRWVRGMVCAAGLWGLTAGAVAQSNGTLMFPVPQVRVDPRPVQPRDVLPPDEQRVVNLFEQAAPAVAYLTTEVVQTNALQEREVSQGAGSGILWDTLGHVVTNHHVIQNARRVFVHFNVGQPVEGIVVGRAPEYDLAVIRLARPLSTLGVDLRPIPLGESRTLRIGQTVYAIGNPFGLQRTLTRGLVSALDRELPTTNQREVLGVIQTDAAINPGNSGGPLLDSAGRLVGVNTAIRPNHGNAAGIGFSIPVDLVNRIVPALISRGRAPLPGIGITPMRPEMAVRLGVQGLVLADVDPHSPAAEAGLQPYNPRTGELGDVIVAVNGRQLPSVSALVTELDRVGMGNLVNLTVVRHIYPDRREQRELQLRVVDLRR